MATRDVPRDEWDSFLDHFNWTHRDSPVSVAKTDSWDGLRFAERATPLVQVTHEENPERISVTVRETPLGDVTHTIRHPDALTVDESTDDENADVALQVIGAGLRIVVRLERPFGPS